MALKATELTLTPTWANKGLTVTGGNPAVREKVALTLIGAATEGGGVPDGLVVRIVPMGRPCPAGLPPWHPLTPVVETVEYARFPLAPGDVWTVAGTDLTGTVDLNTVALASVFGQTSADVQLEARILVESGSADNLYACGRLIIRNWPDNEDAPVAGSSALKLRVDALDTALAEETEAREAADTAEADARAAADLALTQALATKATASDINNLSDAVIALSERIAAVEARFAAFSGLVTFSPLTAKDSEMRAQVKSITDLLRAGL